MKGRLEHKRHVVSSSLPAKISVEKVRKGEFPQIMRKSSESTQFMLQSMLAPKRNGLRGVEKPLVVLISGSSGDAAVRYSSSKKYLEDMGYTVLNKRQITLGYYESTTNLLKPIIARSNSRSVIVWVEAHGLPGWLFAEQPARNSEDLAALDFARFISRLIEDDAEANIGGIVLNACYSGTEYENMHSRAYFSSPARKVSTFFKNTPVVGFIGVNSSTVVSTLAPSSTGIENRFSPVLLPNYDAAILFQDGEIQHAPSDNAYYCEASAVPTFLKSSESPVPAHFGIATKNTIHLRKKPSLDKFSFFEGTDPINEERMSPIPCLNLDKLIFSLDESEPLEKELTPLIDEPLDLTHTGELQAPQYQAL